MAKQQQQKPLTPAEELAQAALRGFFDSPLGFTDMDVGPRKKAVRAIEDVLRQHIEKKKNNS